MKYLLLALFFTSPVLCAARGLNLRPYNIQSVYIYDGLIHHDDAMSVRLDEWARDAVVSVFGWKIKSKPSDADIVLILVPHGEGYGSGTGMSCTNIGISGGCAFGDGSSYNFNCVGEWCSSNYDPGNYLSIVLAKPQGERSVRAIWNSASGFGGFLRGDNEFSLFPSDSSRDQQESLREALWDVCRASGLGGRLKCERELSRSWKSFSKPSSTKGGLITLPSE